MKEITLEEFKKDTSGRTRILQDKNGKTTYHNMDIPLIKSESGLYVDPSVIENNVAKNNKTSAENAMQKYKDRYDKNSNAPAPNIRVPYSYVLTKATPPKMQDETASGLVTNQMEVDLRLAKKLQIMSENVDDQQEVLLCGEHVLKSVCVPGDIVRINYDKYIRINDDHTAGVIQKSYEIPLYEINGEEYLLIDARDIIYAIPTENSEVSTVATGKLAGTN